MGITIDFYTKLKQEYNEAISDKEAEELRKEFDEEININDLIESFNQEFEELEKQDKEEFEREYERFEKEERAKRRRGCLNLCKGKAETDD